MIYGSYSTIDEMFTACAKYILSDNYISIPRKGKIYAQHPFMLELSNPRARHVTYARRNWSLALAFAEFCWHWRAEDSVGPLAFYAPSWANAADQNGRIRGSAYGKQIFRHVGDNLPQWDATKNLLRRHPSTRRAILYFSDSSHDQLNQIDYPCAINLQFIVRKNQLDAAVFMRSSDLYYGFSYDVFLFTLLQEIMAFDLDMQLGSYYHMGSSLHIYEKDVNKIPNDKKPCLEQGMDAIDNISEISSFVKAEKNYREKGYGGAAPLQSRFWNAALDVLFKAVDEYGHQKNNSKRSQQIS